MALAAYRHLLRATRTAFQGDVRLLTAARQEARKGFDKNRRLSSGSEEATAGIAHAEEVARILLRNIVQGRQIGEGTQKYKLRIHDQTERGDNEDFKKGAMRKAAESAGGCWSQ